MTSNGPPAHDLSRTVFISHASDDKEGFVRSLARALMSRGVRVWYDEFVLEIGSSLRESIDEGLSLCEFGVVVLSPNFFRKRWTRKELNALVTREAEGSRDLILPVWHDVDRREVAEFSPLLADRVALRSSDGVEVVADKIVLTIDRAHESSAPTLSPPEEVGSRRAAPGEEWTRIEWHPMVHELWGRSRLVWALLRVSLPSSQEAVVEGVRDALEELGSTAYAYDMVYGDFDGLLKAWVSADTPGRDMLASLSRFVPDLAQAQFFEVDGVVRHWVWMDRDGHGIQLPSSSALRSRPSPSSIHSTSEGQRDDGHLDLLFDEGLIAQISQTGDSIRFFTAVRASGTALVRRQLQNELEQILDSAVGIGEPALYSGSGLGDYAITGQVSAADFDQLRIEITVPVNRAVSRFGGRTQTTLTASQNVLYREEPASGN